MTDPDGSTADATLRAFEDGAWAAGAFVYLVDSGALTESGLACHTAETRGAARILAATGLVIEVDGEYALSPDATALGASGSLSTRHAGLTSSFGQLMRTLRLAPGANEDADAGWATQSDETLRAQGRASAFGGTMLARFAVPNLQGLAERFDGGGWFLDVGVGVGELTAAFCDALPDARVVGLDVLPRVLGLAAGTLAERDLTARVELREQGVQDLDDLERFDLAWLPSPFIPQPIFSSALSRIHAALQLGGWIVVGAGRFDGGALASAVTKWKTTLAGGTPLDADAAIRALTDAGFGEVTTLPTPPGAPALYAGRR